MEFVRTAAHRFLNLPDYPFQPHYTEVGDGALRMHYVDEGPATGPVVLMLHGEPSWSYLYRHMIPICAQAGNRVIAPDLVGFGKSDKPTRISDYSFATHVAWMTDFVIKLNLRDVTLVCQDWGSLIGLRVAAENEGRFARIVLSNGMLPTGDKRLPPAFKLWRAFAERSPILPVGGIVAMGTKRALTPRERAAYDAPFPSKRHQAGARAFPSLVPASPADPAAAANRAAWEVLDRWEKPFLLAFSDGDPITKGADRYVAGRVPGTKGQPHVTLRGGHFVQEDSPKEFAGAVNDLIARTR
ncbi:MAG: haloalkane dehalogenase [Myxococcales bacterium]|nr:haloalkane dehalogenase [Myxococcales bacterium]MCB9625829.1 haloalkane dehalogenase [Sandaracinaceae bacterium]